MRFHQAIATAAFLAVVAASADARAFEMTTVGGTNADGSARYQDPDEQPALSSPFGDVKVQTGMGTGTNWLTTPGSSGFGFSASGNASAEPNTPFNTPILRQRN